jgi:hypothetical protein
LNDAGDARETRADWQTARIVAMLRAVHSKRGRYEPVKYMLNGRALAREMREAREEREPMTGEQIIQRFRQLGVPIIDKRRLITDGRS